MPTNLELKGMSQGSAKQGTSTNAGSRNMTVWGMDIEAKAPAHNAQNSMQDLYAAVCEWLICKWLWLSFKLYSHYNYHVN